MNRQVLYMFLQNVHNTTVDLNCSPSWCSFCRQWRFIQCLLGKLWPRHENRTTGLQHGKRLWIFGLASTGSDRRKIFSQGMGLVGDCLIASEVPSMTLWCQRLRNCWKTLVLWISSFFLRDLMYEHRHRSLVYLEYHLHIQQCHLGQGGSPWYLCQMGSSHV